MTGLDFDFDQDNFNPSSNSNKFDDIDDIDDFDSLEDDDFVEDDLGELEDLDEDYFNKNLSDFEQEDGLEEDYSFGIEPGQEDFDLEEDDSVDFDDEL